MVEIITPIPFSQSALGDFCNMWNIPIGQTEQNPEVAFHVLNALWGIPIIDGPQSARRPPLLAIGRVVGETFNHSYSQPFQYSVGTVMSRMQAWPALYEFETRLFGMSEAELVEAFDRTKGFVDRHSGIAVTLGTVGVGGAVSGKSPSETVRAIGSRAAAGGEALGEAVSTRIGNVTQRAGDALATRSGAAFGIIGAAIYVLTIAEGYEKLEDIRNVATIKYRNGDIAETTFRHIMSFHPTDEVPTLYFEE